MAADTALGVNDRPDSPTEMEMVLAGAVETGITDDTEDVGGGVDEGGECVGSEESAGVEVVVVAFGFVFVEVARVVGLVTVVEVRTGIEAMVVGVCVATASVCVFESMADSVAVEKAMLTKEAKMARRNDILVMLSVDDESDDT